MCVGGCRIPAKNRVHLAPAHDRGMLYAGVALFRLRVRHDRRHLPMLLGGQARKNKWTMSQQIRWYFRENGKIAVYCFLGALVIGFPFLLSVIQWEHWKNIGILIFAAPTIGLLSSFFVYYIISNHLGFYISDKFLRKTYYDEHYDVLVIFAIAICSSLLPYMAIISWYEGSLLLFTKFILVCVILCLNFIALVFTLIYFNDILEMISNHELDRETIIKEIILISFLFLTFAIAKWTPLLQLLGTNQVMNKYYRSLQETITIITGMLRAM